MSRPTIDPRHPAPARAPASRFRVATCRAAVNGMLGLLVAASFATAATARGIVVDDLQDNSDSTPNYDSSSLKLQFDHRLQVQAPTLRGNRAELDLRYQWSFGALVDADLLGLGRWLRDLGWSLTITVEDPDRRGFDLSVSNHLLGMIGSGGTFFGGYAYMPPITFWMYEVFATTPTQLNGLNTGFAWVAGSDQQLMDERGRHDVGRYRGTQSFLFYIGPVATDLRGVAAESFAWMQFGRRNNDPDMAFMNSIPSDLAMDDLGLHLSLRVDYLPPAVPEPAAWLLLALGLPLLMARQRARSA
jgi:hypothetical protein